MNLKREEAPTESRARAEVGSGRPSGRVSPAIVDSIFAAGTGLHYDTIVDDVLHGHDRRWKEALLDRVVAPKRALDLACGTGILTGMLRARYPNCEIVGVDMTEEYLDVARGRARDRGDDRVRFIHSPAEDAPLEGCFDLIMTCYLPKYAALGQLIPRLVEHLEPGGLMIMQDFVWPRDRLTGQFLDRRFDSLIEWAGANLPQAVGMFADLRPVIKESRWMDELSRLMGQCGLIDVQQQFFVPEQAAMVWAHRPGGGPVEEVEDRHGR